MLGAARGAAFLLVASLAQGEQAELADLLKRARAATGVDAFRKSGRDLVVSGTQNQAGVAGTWTARIAADGKFVRAVEGELPERDGWDGAVTWHADASGMAVSEALAVREHLLLDAGLATGAWCLESGPILVTGMKPAAAEGVRTLLLRARDGVLPVELDVDAESGLPAALRWRSNGQLQSWSWTRWHAAVAGTPGGDLAVPDEITTDDDGVVSTTKFAVARLEAPAPPSSYARPTARPNDTTFDPAAPSRLDGKRARTGHLIVHAALAGQEPAWYVFDSGAGACALSKTVVDEQKLARFGERRIGGGGAARETSRFVRTESFTIGPVTVKGLIWSELDLSGLETGFGVKLAGIVGFDLLLRAVAVVDMKTGAVDLFDPKQFARDGVVWSPLLLHGNHAHVRAGFDHDGEEEGIFRLDTGAPGVTVLFHSPAVHALGLLEGAGTPVVGLAGIGGQMRARHGTVDVFRIGGKVFDQPKVIFCEDEIGAMADPWTTGTIGGGLLEDFDVIFDYPHDRIGFVEHGKTK